MVDGWSTCSVIVVTGTVYNPANYVNMYQSEIYTIALMKMLVNGL